MATIRTIRLSFSMPFAAKVNVTMPEAVHPFREDMEFCRFPCRVPRFIRIVRATITRRRLPMPTFPSEVR